jgi:hypothetical protein
MKPIVTKLQTRLILTVLAASLGAVAIWGIDLFFGGRSSPGDLAVPVLIGLGIAIAAYVFPIQRARLTKLHPKDGD